jgi:hypothetical protein
MMASRGGPGLPSRLPAGSQWVPEALCRHALVKRKSPCHHMEEEAIQGDRVHELHGLWQAVRRGSRRAGRADRCGAGAAVCPAGVRWRASGANTGATSGPGWVGGWHTISFAQTRDLARHGGDQVERFAAPMSGPPTRWPGNGPVGVAAWVAERKAAVEHIGRRFIAADVRQAWAILPSFCAVMDYQRHAFCAADAEVRVRTWRRAGGWW